VRSNRLNPVGLIVVVLGATMGAVLALVLVRRWRRGGEVGFGEIPWRELITLVGPIVALTRGLIEMTRRELIELEG
jgi:hypothetical protein